jgi:hypothetical protein
LVDDFPKTQNQLLDEWLLYRDIYLQEILKLEAPPPQMACQSCKINDYAYRCQDCFGEPVFCQACCLTTHKREPYHTIQRWTGNCFVQSTLHDLGLILDLGHGGDCCPAYKNSPDIVGQDFSFSNTSKGSVAEDVIWVVHTSGVFRSRVRYCGCIDAPERHIQLLRLKLFPASFVRPSTAFTFALLDHFEIDAMECKTSAMNFFAKLKRLTSNAFPHEVPVSN